MLEYSETWAEVCDRPCIYAVDTAWDALVTHNEPVHLLRLGSAPVVVENVDGEAVVLPQSADSMRVQLARAARWFAPWSTSLDDIEEMCDKAHSPDRTSSLRCPESSWPHRFTSEIRASADTPPRCPISRLPGFRC